MTDVSINLWAVIAATVLNMAIGTAWYGPLLGKPWMKFVGMSPQKLEAAKKKGMGKTMGTALFASFVMAYILALMIGWLGVTGSGEGLKVGAWIWLGFLATTQIDVVLWEDRPRELYLINTSYRLVSLALMGAMLGAWR